MKKYLVLFVLAAALALPAKAQTTPCPSGSTCSGGLAFTVTFSVPITPQSVSPTAVAAGAPSTTVTLAAATGGSFNNTMTVLLCQQTPTPCTTATSLVTTFVSATSLTAVIPATSLNASGTFLVYLAQPAGAHAVNLNWTAPVADATHDAASAYNVKRGAVSGGPTQRSAVAG